MRVCTRNNKNAQILQRSTSHHGYCYVHTLRLVTIGRIALIYVSGALFHNSLTMGMFLLINRSYVLKVQLFLGRPTRLLLTEKRKAVVGSRVHSLSGSSPGALIMCASNWFYGFWMNSLKLNMFLFCTLAGF